MRIEPKARRPVVSFAVARPGIAGRVEEARSPTFGKEFHDW
jgi:hypothetical protein